MYLNVGTATGILRNDTRTTSARPLLILRRLGATCDVTLSREHRRKGTGSRDGCQGERCSAWEGGGEDATG